MTFTTLDDVLDSFESIAADKMRAFETAILLGDGDDLTDDLGDVIDASRELHDRVMEDWRAQTRRQLAALPLKFPLTLTWETPNPPRTPSPE
jgi:hypothetical protein